MVTTLMDTVTYTQSTGNPTVLPQATSYQYDQLNRLVEAQAYQNIDPTLNKWLSGSTYAGLYNNKFVYDANGNILSQQRRDSSGTLVDNLVYHYAQQAGHTIANRLYHVNDSVTTTHTTSDIEDQGTYTADLNQINYKNNYSYDPIGNLSKDSSEQIATIQWSVYGKIKAVYRTAGSNKKNLLFDYDPSGNRVAKRVLDSRGNLLYVDYYTRDAQGNIMAIYKRRNLGDSLAGFMLKERNIYGSSMIGTSYDTLEMIGAHLDTVNAFHHLGNKNFFLENHLGNVLATVSDKKIPRFTNGILDHYEADIISSTDYYGFGQEEEGRNFNSKASRYGFNGKMKDNEVEGEGDVYDFGARMYDARLGRWLSLDPDQNLYANLTPYCYSANSPLILVDKSGNKITIANDLSAADKVKIEAALKQVSEKLPDLYNFLQNARVHCDPDPEKNTQTIVMPGEENYDKAFDIVIQVGIKNLDGKPASVEKNQALEENMSSGVSVNFDNGKPEKLRNGETTVSAGNVGFSGISQPDKNKPPKLFVLGEDQQLVLVDIKSPSDLNQPGSRFNMVLKDLTNSDPNAHHFEVNLDDYLNFASPGEVIAHELGHVESYIKDPANTFFHKAVKGDLSSGHGSGNKSGENADMRQNQYNKRN